MTEAVAPGDGPTPNDAPLARFVHDPVTAARPDEAYEAALCCALTLLDGLLPHVDPHMRATIESWLDADSPQWRQGVLTTPTLPVPARSAHVFQQLLDDMSGMRDGVRYLRERTLSSDTLPLVNFILCRDPSIFFDKATKNFRYAMSSMVLLRVRYNVGRVADAHRMTTRQWRSVMRCCALGDSYVAALELVRTRHRESVP